MIKVSGISPLIFGVKNTGFERSVEYIQKFSSSDTPILIQVVDAPYKRLTMSVTNLDTGGKSTINPVLTVVNAYNTLYEFAINMPQGLYQAVLIDLDERPGESSIVSIPFFICSNSAHLSDTIEIEYTNENNITSFGAVFKVGSVEKVFRLRVEGGFKSDSHALAISNEQFRTQRQEIIELYAIPYEVSTLTIGSNEGVPFEMARLINNIFCLSSVRINGVRYVRSESSIPEQQLIADRISQFNYILKLELADNISYNGYTEYPDGTEAEGYASLQITDPEDGQVLVFKKEAGSFINQSNLDSI